MARLSALWLLAGALVRAVVSWPLRRGRALQAFRDNYGPEGLLPVSSDVHRQLVSAGGCTGCGRCDRVSSGTAVPLSQLLRGWTRSLPDADICAAEFAHYPEAELARAEELCPFGVPIVALAQMTRTQAEQMSRH